MHADRCGSHLFAVLQDPEALTRGLCWRVAALGSDIGGLRGAGIYMQGSTFTAVIPASMVGPAGVRGREEQELPLHVDVDRDEPEPEEVEVEMEEDSMDHGDEGRLEGYNKPWRGMKTIIRQQERDGLSEIYFDAGL